MELQDHSTYRKLGLKAIEPEGWMKEILRRYADGLLGSLEEIWPYVDSSNAWKGGDGDSWERGPYYVDGLVPMAFLLRDQELIGKARIWIESAISSQLKTLKASRLVRPRKDGRMVYYRLCDEHIAKILETGKEHSLELYS